MAKKQSSEDKLIEKINDINEKMVEIQQEPIKKVEKKKTTTKKKKQNEVIIPIDPLNEEVVKVSENVQGNEKVFGIFETIVIVVVFALIFCVLGFVIGNKNFKDNDKDYTSVNKEIQSFIEEYNYILENYYGDISKEDLIQAAIKGMLGSLDEYSGFIGDESDNFNITLEGKYEGLGVEISNDQDGNIVVRGVYENTPASKANIKVGDFITKFGDNDLKGKTSTELVAMIKQATNIKLTIKRAEETFNVDLKKEKIELTSVNFKMLEDNVGYINISIFANNSYTQFKNALNQLEKDGMKKLIIDVRGNSGGYLSTTENILNLFVDASHVVYQTDTKGEIKKYYSKGTNNKEYPIAILQDGLSASASEVLASSLKDNLNAYIIGTKSYGKGTVQELQNVSGIGQYKFTTKKWLTPNGVWINGTGITPDLEVKLNNEYFESPSFDTDNQLKSAIEYLKTK